MDVLCMHAVYFRNNFFQTPLYRHTHAVLSPDTSSYRAGGGVPSQLVEYMTEHSMTPMHEQDSVYRDHACRSLLYFFVKAFFRLWSL